MYRMFTKKALYIIIHQFNKYEKKISVLIFPKNVLQVEMCVKKNVEVNKFKFKIVFKLNFVTKQWDIY